VKLTVGMDEKFTTSYSDEKEVSVEVESVTLTPNGTLSIIKPDRTAKEILTDVQALVKIRNKKGQGVATALPISVQWRFEDPDDVANDAKRIIDRNGSEGNDNTSIADGGIAAGWKLPPGSGYGILTTEAKQLATTNTDGENKGKSLKKFVSSVIAGDNYIIVADVLDRNASVLKSGRTGIWTVRKKVTNDYVYEMPGSLNMAQVMSKANIDPAFSKDGCTDYTAAKTVTKLPAPSPTKLFIVELVDPTPAQLPSKEDLDAFKTYNKAAQDAAESRMKAKAQSWYDDNQKYINAQLEKFANDNNIQRPAVVSVRYLHPKHDGDDATGKTNYYPPFVMINVGTPTQPISLQPDGGWGPIDGAEQFGIAWFFKNAAAKGEKRLQIAGRHEIGHRSDHTKFGWNNSDDHAEEGLMSPSGGMTFLNQIGDPEFSAESINKLRGRQR
jgi:hypothetical protein